MASSRRRVLSRRTTKSLLVLWGSIVNGSAFCPSVCRQQGGSSSSSSSSISLESPLLSLPYGRVSNFQNIHINLRASVSNSEEIPQQQDDSLLERDEDGDGDGKNENGASAAPLIPSITSEKPGKSRNSARKAKRKMDLMWCTSEFCKDVVRERVVGDHNQIVLNGPATGQVAYQWDGGVQSEERHGMKVPTTASVLLLVKPSDELYKITARAVKQLTEGEIEVLLVPELAAKLKHYHGVDDDRISLFEPPPEDGTRRAKRFSMENEAVWFGDSFSDGHTPFPDLVCTLGGDGLLMHASMMFQGACPPMLSIAGGSLGFLTPFSTHEMVDAIRIALGLVQGQHTKPPGLNGSQSDTSSSNLQNSNELEVFPPNMPSYPYEPLVKAPHAQNSTPKFSFGFGDSICLSIRMRLDCRIVSREGSVKARYNVLNEVVIDRGSSPYLAALECFCDDVHLTTVQADGVIIATPTGSTAYSMAAGGSVVHPAVPSILVTPICPHVLSFRSMIFPDHVVLRCYVPEDARSPASVAFDGKHRRELQRGDSVQIQMSTYPVPTINRGDHSSDWLESLKRSFNFNTRPRQQPL